MSYLSLLSFYFSHYPNYSLALFFLACRNNHIVDPQVTEIEHLAMAGKEDSILDFDKWKWQNRCAVGCWCTSFGAITNLPSPSS
jgi:hypothetical protein